MESKSSAQGRSTNKNQAPATGLADPSISSSSVALTKRPRRTPNKRIVEEQKLPIVDDDSLNSSDELENDEEASVASGSDGSCSIDEDADVGDDGDPDENFEQPGRRGRKENGLVTLTLRFIKLLKRAPNQTLDLNIAVEKLAV